MKSKKKLVVSVALFMVLLLFGISCIHDPIVSCDAVSIKIDVAKTNASKSAKDGTLIISATGSSNYFTYSINGSEYQASGTFLSLDSGNYKVYAKNSWGCTATADVHIDKVNPCTGVSLTTSVTNATSGKSDGSIKAALSGATGYLFSLNNGAFTSNTTFSGLAAGTYTVTAKNSSGCTFVTHATIASSNPCSGVTVTISALKVDPTLNQSDGQILVSATGGSSFTYSLSGAAFVTNNTFTGLAAGNYTITAKNSDGCLGTTTVTLGSNNQCTGVTVVVTGTVTNATAGGANGSITASASGGTGFTYNLNGGAFGSSGTFSNLAAGSYTITAKTSAGCLGSKTFTIGSADPCAAISIVISATTTVSANCVTTGTGMIVATASGSSGFTYSINGGAYQTSGTFVSLNPGAYVIGVKDSGGCTTSSPVTVGTEAAGPKFLAVRDLLQTRCSGGSCHTNGQSQAGYNFDTDCKIVSAGSSVYSAGVTRSSMPISPQSKLTAAEKQLIIDWYNAGHTFNK